MQFFIMADIEVLKRRLQQQHKRADAERNERKTAAKTKFDQISCKWEENEKLVRCSISLLLNVKCDSVLYRKPKQTMLLTNSLS
jgi:hypothetical protein